MPSDSEERSRQRRELVRRVVGKPGSWRRWGIGTALWLLGAFALASRADFLTRIPIFLVAVIMPLAALRARSLLVGDEDELRADLRAKRASVRPASDGEQQPEEPDWYLSQDRGFEGVPLPPVADTAGSSDDGASQGSETEPT